MTINSNENRCLNDLPQKWETRFLKHKLRKITDGAHVSPDTSENAYPFVSTVDIENGTINFESCLQTSAESFSMLSSQGCRPKVGDVLFSKDGTVGRTALISFDKDFAVASSLIILTPPQAEVFPAFLDFMLRSHIVLEQINSFVKGSALKRVSLLNIKKVIGVFPPVEEQIRIATYLDKTCAAIDKAIEAKQKQLETLDALRQSIIHKAVTRGLDDSVELKDSGVEWLGRIPSTWHSQRIKDVAKLSPGFSVGKPTMTDLCTVIPMEAVSKNGEISTDQVQELNSISGGLTNFEVGDIIFAKITPCMENGKGAYITALPTKYAFGSTEFHVLRPSDKVDGKFLYYYTFNSVYRKYAEKNMTGAAGQKRVSSNFLKYTRICLPDVMTQRQIADYLDEKCSELTGLQLNIDVQISTLEQYRKSLIHECVTGKRRITEDDVQNQL
jgi:type I restriction enzyme S subunit